MQITFAFIAQMNFSPWRIPLYEDQWLPFMISSQIFVIFELGMFYDNHIIYFRLKFCNAFIDSSCDFSYPFSDVSFVYTQAVFCCPSALRLKWACEYVTGTKVINSSRKPISYFKWRWMHKKFQTAQCSWTHLEARWLMRFDCKNNFIDTVLFSGRFKPSKIIVLRSPNIGLKLPQQKI